MQQPYIQILTTISKNMTTGYDRNIAGFSNTIMTSNEMEIMRSWSKTMFSTPPTRIPKDVSSNLFSKMCSSKFVSSKIRINNIWLGVNQTNSFKKTLYNGLLVVVVSVVVGALFVLAATVVSAVDLVTIVVLVIVVLVIDVVIFDSVVVSLVVSGIFVVAAIVVSAVDFVTIVVLIVVVLVTVSAKFNRANILVSQGNKSSWIDENCNGNFSYKFKVQK
jgi:hypothetical protein